MLPFRNYATRLAARASRTQANAIKKLAKDNRFTLRQVVDHSLSARRSPFVGSPLTVANEIQRWFEGGGFDGINISVTVPSEFALFTEKVLPILRERGVVRSEYEATTLRGNLGLPIPENRYTAARQQVVAPTDPVANDSEAALALSSRPL